MQPLPQPCLPNGHCPLCGQDNRCAPAASGSLDTPCWCRDVVISHAVLARIPEPLRGMHCLCSRCASGQARDQDSQRSDAAMIGSA
jgi:hypothetical protein